MYKDIIGQYLDSRKYAWSEATKRSERYRLYGLEPYITGDPVLLWKQLELTQKPYARVTSWTRVTQFWEWMVNNGKEKSNPYKAWREENARLFKNTYEKKKPEISYQEAKERISTIRDTELRHAASVLLETGLRLHEAHDFRDGRVMGKGGKYRRVFRDDSATGFSDSKLRRTLAHLGLKPHLLRKLFLSRLVELGANPFELAEIAGWSSIETASSYIKLNENRLRRLVESA